MSSRTELITKLVTTNHLNVDERRELVPPVVAKDELAAVIRAILSEQAFFPPHARPWSAGNQVYEGYIIERQADAFMLHLQRHDPLNPCALAESSKRQFPSLDKAVVAFIDKEYGAEIDGIRIA